MNRDNESLIALFIDYDNIAIGLKESGGHPFEVRRVLERLLEKGRIIYKRAYADWYLFSDGKQPLHEHAIEMIDIPMRRNIGKNSADIRLVVDALDLCYTKEHIDTFVIGSGDSDFTPLVSKLKENDKRVIGFGLTGSTSNLLANNCDEFIFYEDLVTLPINRPALPTGLTKRQHDAFSMVLDAMAALMRENKDVLWGSLIKDTIRRKRPSFTEAQYGYSSFSQLLEDAAKHQLIGLIKDPKSGGTPVVTGFGLASEGTGAARTTGETKAAPVPQNQPSLLVKPESGAVLPSSTSDEEKSARKPTKTPGRRRGPRKKTDDKPAEDTAVKKASGKKADEAKSDKAEDKADTTEEKPAAKKPARRSTRRRTSSAKKSEEKAPKDAPAEPAPEETAAAPESVKEKEDKPKKAASRSRTSAKKKTTPSAKADESKLADKDSKKPETRASKPDSKKEEEAKPKGQPLRSRVRRRRR